MDKAIVGKCRVGYTRVGVKGPFFDTLVDQLENVSAKTLGGITPCIQGVARQGQTRQRVYLPLFDQLMSEFEKK